GPPAPSLQEGARMLGACPRRLAECWRLTARYAKRSGGGWVKCLRNYARRTGDRGRIATRHTMMMTAMAISPMMRNVLSVATMLPTVVMASDMARIAPTIVPMNRRMSPVCAPEPLAGYGRAGPSRMERWAAERAVYEAR